MNITLKSTVMASLSLAGLMNAASFASSYNHQATASFAPKSDQAVQTTATKVTTASSAATSPTAIQAAVVAAGGTVATPAPSPEPVNASVTNAAKELGIMGLNPAYAASYVGVEAKTGTPWELVAAVHRVETSQSGNTSRASGAGAKGPMQFMPSTWAAYARDGDGNGTADITDVDDALLTGGRYLAAGGADKGHYSTALYNYNHSDAYVAKVLRLATQLGM